MAITKELIPVLGPITAAVIAGSISFVISVLSKDQKTSEFRQQWIDSLRNEVSELVSLFEVMHGTLSIKERRGESRDSLGNFILEKRDEFIKMELFATKIKLRLNPKEHKKILFHLSKIIDGKIESREEASSTISAIASETQEILKEEWERVKAGELSFRITKWTSLIVFLASLAIVTAHLMGHITITYAP